MVEIDEVNRDLRFLADRILTSFRGRRLGRSRLPLTLSVSSAYSFPSRRSPARPRSDWVLWCVAVARQYGTGLVLASSRGRRLRPHRFQEGTDESPSIHARTSLVRACRSRRSGCC